MVLLDENLLKLIHDNPLYIRSHCKAILRAAIHSDAYFLSSHLIIDYSLLVGRDDATDQLVVGIIGEKTSEVKVMSVIRGDFFFLMLVMRSCSPPAAYVSWSDSVGILTF